MSPEAQRVPVCVFAKPPVAGEVKTRLSRGIGAARAARLARAFFHDTWATVRALPWARPILASTTADTSAFELASDDVEVWLQGPGDLGERMERILARGLAEAGLALLIGADIPGLPPAHLEQARAVLGRNEAVLGRTEDGGFYVIGLSRLPPGLLADLPWGSPDTLARTEERLTRAPSWFDVDETDDLARLRRRLADDPRAAPQTWLALSGPA